jgi:hypothetical protein
MRSPRIDGPTNLYKQFTLNGGGLCFQRLVGKSVSSGRLKNETYVTSHERRRFRQHSGLQMVGRTNAHR